MHRGGADHGSAPLSLPSALQPARALPGLSIVRLFDPFTLRGVTFRNRIGISPMCEYSSSDGFATDWHLVHLGSRAVGGAGLILTEAAAVEAGGRISAGDLGIYDDAHVSMLARIAAFIADRGAVPGMQLAHAGRKASTAPPWEGGGPVGPDRGGWSPIFGPSALPFDAEYQVPHALGTDEIARLVRAFGAAAERAIRAGFRVLEIHAAHGYLVHAFLSPLSNHRTDAYGGDRAGRSRFLHEIVAETRRAMPSDSALFVRISATDWAPGGWTADDSVALASELREVGVDLVDCSTGGNLPHATIPVGPGYQVPFAERVRREAHIPTAAVGMITEAAQAEEIVASGAADLVLLARASLRDPYWPLHAAHELGAEIAWPHQYERGRPRIRTHA